MLRAFRLASQLDFTIEDKITKFIEDKSSLIKEVAKERIGNELFLLLENPLSYGYLENLAAKTLLKQILGKNPNLESLKRLENILFNKKIIDKHLKEKITTHLLEKKGTRVRKDLLKFITLIFSPHQKENSLSLLGKDLKLGRKDMEMIKRIEKLYPFLERMMENKEKPPDTTPFLMQAKRETVEICLLFLVSHLHQQNSVALITKILKEYFRKSSLILHPPSLIKGEDLMEILNITPSPYISYLLDKIHQAQIKEEIKSKEEAVEYVKRLVSEEGEKKKETLYAKHYPL
jgi:tRNA nucleotidyltransferase (CCA-adding enzyme)